MNIMTVLLLMLLLLILLLLLLLLQLLPLLLLLLLLLLLQLLLKRTRARLVEEISKLRMQHTDAEGLRGRPLNHDHMNCDLKQERAFSLSQCCKNMD